MGIGMGMGMRLFRVSLSAYMYVQEHIRMDSKK